MAQASDREDETGGSAGAAKGGSGCLDPRGLQRYLPRLVIVVERVRRFERAGVDLAGAEAGPPAGGFSLPARLNG